MSEDKILTCEHLFEGDDSPCCIECGSNPYKIIGTLRAEVERLERERNEARERIVELHEIVPTYFEMEQDRDRYKAVVDAVREVGPFQTSGAWPNLAVDKDEWQKVKNLFAQLDKDEKPKDGE
jgi:hypothetical protein